MVLYLLCSLVLAFMVSWSGKSLSLLVTPLLGSWTSLALVTPPLLLGSLASSALVTPPQVCGVSQASCTLVTPPWSVGWSLASGLLAGDNSGLWGELALASAVGDSCLLVRASWLLLVTTEGRGMDTLLSILTWGLLWRWLKAASL